MPVTWSDEKLILLYCPGRGSNSRPSAHRGFKHEQGVPRPYSLGPKTSLLWNFKLSRTIFSVFKRLKSYINFKDGVAISRISFLDANKIVRFVTIYLKRICGSHRSSAPQTPRWKADTLRAIRHRQRSTPGGHLLARCVYRRTGPDLPDAWSPKPRRYSCRGREYDHHVEVRVRGWRCARRCGCCYSDCQSDRTGCRPPHWCSNGDIAGQEQGDAYLPQDARQLNDWIAIS